MNNTINIFVSVLLAVLFFAVLTVLFFFRDSVLNWCRRNKKKALGIGITITVISAGTGYVLYSLGDEQPPFIDPAAFIWHPGNGYGGMPRWEINKTYAKQFLKDNMKWRLQASPNNETWYDADELLKIGLDWNESDCSYKVTLTLNTTNAPQSLYYRFDLACNKSLKQFFEIDGYEWTLTVPANNTMDYTLRFNWSDIKPLKQNGKVWFDRGVKNNFFWFRIQSVNKIAVGQVFVVDPIYGVIPAAVTDSLEWDQAEGRVYGQNAVVRLNSSEYYLMVAAGDTGTDADGFAMTIKVFDDNGTLWTNTANIVISSFEYDITDGADASVCWIPGTDKYVVAYCDKGSAKVTLVTLQVWDNNGTIKPSVIDSQQCTYPAMSYSWGYSGFLNLLRVYDNVYLVSYNDDTSLDGFMETYWIDYTGMINNSRLDIEEYDATYGPAPYVCQVDTNTVALTYLDSSDTGEYMLMTYNISTAGLITDTPADSWSYETSPYNHANIGVSSCITKIGASCYAICFIDASYDIYVKTLSISDSGVITESWIDTLLVYNGAVAGIGRLYPFFVNSPLVSSSGNGVMGTTFSSDGTAVDGLIYTWNVTSAGVLGNAVIDYLKYDDADYYTSSVCWINQSWYLITFTGGGYDGWSCTVSIDTNWASPVFSSPSPANSSTGQSLTPKCAITVNDINVDTMSITFAENSTGSWVNRQTNSSVTNGTYRWTFAQATAYNTNYWWKVYANDSMHNVTEWYKFTTRAENSPTFSTPLPANASTGRPLTPKTNITINDADGDTMTLTWFNNKTGSWVNYGHNNTVGNGTYRQTETWASSYSTKYWWKVYCNDGINNVSAIYHFTTKADTYKTNLTLLGLTTNWNVTWNGSIPTVGNNVTFCNSSGLEFETVELDIDINATEWVDTVYFWASWLNDTINNTQIYTDNITVWVSDDNLTWGVLQHNIGNGMGRFQHTSGYLVWNWSHNPAGVDPFTYYPTYGYFMKSNVTLYARYQLNITTTASAGLHHNLSGSPWQISIANYSAGIGPDIVATESFTTQAEIENAPGVVNHAPVQSVPFPVNTSYDADHGTTLAITVNDLDDLTQNMDLTWQTNTTGGWVTFAYNYTVNNGTYRQFFNNSTMAGHKYWWRVLVNDSLGLWDNETYYFTVENDTVWYKSSSYYCYIEINDLSFDPITVSDEYVLFNTTDFKVTSENRTNISIMFINTSITGASAGDLLVDFYADCRGGLTRFNISGFNPTANYTVKKNYEYVGNYTANISGDIQFINSIWIGIPRFQIYLKSAATSAVYSTSIRTNAGDYFVWLGDNTTAYWVYKNLTGLNEAAEYVAIYNNSGIWGKFYGDKTGWNFTIHTYDVVRTYMNDAVGNITFDMLSNPDIDYDAHRTVYLYPNMYGYNYTGYTNITATTLNGINQTLDLGQGYFCGLWNRTTFTWNYWIADFGITDKYVARWNVIVTKLAEGDDKVWVL